MDTTTEPKRNDAAKTDTTVPTWGEVGSTHTWGDGWRFDQCATEASAPSKDGE